ncbi:MAG: hypothetical protein M3275_04635 [Thermoproteota archaeon]|nr:hypothetical protein [Thermoproteota archaeon]
MMMIHKRQQQHLERVIYEEAQELAHQRNWSVSFTLSVMWSRFKDARDTREAEAAFVLMQREEERKGVKDPIFTEW